MHSRRAWPASQRAALVLAALAFLVHGYARQLPMPDIWVSPRTIPAEQPSTACDYHPEIIYGKHPSIAQDGGIRIELIGAAGNKHMTLCPGRTYTMQVGFGGQERSALITASAGVFYANTASGQDMSRYLYPEGNNARSCPNRLVALPTPHVATAFSVPCDASEPISIRVTSAFMPMTELKQATAVFNIKPGCAAKACNNLLAGAAAGRGRRRTRRSTRGDRVVVQQ